MSEKKNMSNERRPAMNKVTTEELRAMGVGDTLTFALPDASAIYTGKALAYRLGPVLKCKFRALADFGKGTLAVTKLPLGGLGAQKGGRP